MFSGIRDSLKEFSSSAKKKITKKELTEEEIESILWDLESSLLKNNVAVDVIDKIKEDLKKDLKGESVGRTQVENFVREELEKSLREILDQEKLDIESIIQKEDPALFLFMGFNGSGKTTTIAKVAQKLKEDYGVVLAAGDTFRAASIEQLQKHADNLDVELIKQDYGSDSAAVIYDAKEFAEKNHKDVVLGDTAGRSHTDKNLMEELNKIVRVNSPDLKILVVDALAGNDAIEQAKKYKDIGFDAIIVSKADVDERGGSILSLSYISGKPILYLGVGQNYEDLREFDPDKVIDKIFQERG